MNKPIAKITVTFEDGTGTVVTPGSGHSIIFALGFEGKEVAHVAAGDRTLVCELSASLAELYPWVVPYTKFVATKRLFLTVNDAGFDRLPIGGTA